MSSLCRRTVKQLVELNHLGKHILSLGTYLDTYMFMLQTREKYEIFTQKKKDPEQ